MYTYDTLDRLTKGQYFATGYEEFAYDKLGNRNTETDTRTAEPDYSYTHNPVNEYSQIVVDGTTKTPEYDAAGNLTQDHRGYKYYYDQDNRLTQIRDSAGTVTKATYTYDALGRRIESVIGTTTTRYYYDGQKVLLDANGSGTNQRYYVWGNYIDEVLMMRDCVGSADYYYGHDNRLILPV